MTTNRSILIIAIIAFGIVLIAFGRPRSHTDLGNTLVITSQSPPDSLDTAISYQQVAWLIFANTYDGLLTYPKVPGAAGSKLVPDLAAAMPTITDGGKTYSFTMRKGIRFGPPANREVLPSDVKYGIERLFDPDMASPGQGFYTGIVGAQDVVDKKAKEISGIVVDDAARTIVFHLTAPDATMPFKLAMPFSFPVPKGTPNKDQTQEGFLPALGPYMFSKFEPGREIVLKRNPNFKQWTDATPAAFADGVTIKLGITAENGFIKIKRGEADWMFDAVPRSAVAMLLNDGSLKAQTSQETTASTSFLFMDTKVPPFDNVKVRQAVNYAIDRNALVKLAAGTMIASENILPPILPGYVKHTLYPGPDLAKAKQLISESGVTPGKIGFWYRCTDSAKVTAEYFQTMLNGLGFTTDLKCLDSSVYFTTIGTTKNNAQIGTFGWNQDFPEGSDFIDVLLNGKRITPTGNNNTAQFDDPTINAEIAKANALIDQDARNKAWAKLDLEISKLAPWAVYGNSVDLEFWSKRVEQFSFAPTWAGPIFSMMKIKDQDGRDTPATTDSGSASATGGGLSPTSSSASVTGASNSASLGTTDLDATSSADDAADDANQTAYENVTASTPGGAFAPLKRRAPASTASMVPAGGLQ